MSTTKLSTRILCVIAALLFVIATFVAFYFTGVTAFADEVQTSSSHDITVNTQSASTIINNNGLSLTSPKYSINITQGQGLAGIQIDVGGASGFIYGGGSTPPYVKFSTSSVMEITITATSRHVTAVGFYGSWVYSNQNIDDNALTLWGDYVLTVITDLNANESYTFRVQGSLNVYSISVYSLPYQEDVYQDGYDTGYNDGVEVGTTTANNTVTESSASYTAGYSRGLAEASDYSFLSLISAVIDVPVKTFVNLFDFEIFGYSMLTFVSALLAIGTFIAVLRRIF